MRSSGDGDWVARSEKQVERATLTRRSALAFVLGTASAALLSACGSAVQAPPASPPTTAPAPTSAPAPAPTSAPAPPTPAAAAQPTPVVAAPTAAPQPQPRAGGTLTAAIQADLPNVDPHFNSPAAYDALWVAFDRLIYLDNKLQPQPMLAESWDLSPDYKRVTFHLRKGVQFSSGRELTSDDVKYNLLRVRDPKIGGGGWVGFSNWWTIDT